MSERRGGRKPKACARRSTQKVLWLDRGWFPFFYGFCPSEAAWRREMRNLKVEATYPTADAKVSEFCNNDGDTVNIVTVAETIDKRDPLGIIALLVHEAAHVWQRCCDAIGEKKPSAEFEAYAMQRISAQLILAYEKTRRRLTLAGRGTE